MMVSSAGIPGLSSKLFKAKYGEGSEQATGPLPLLDCNATDEHWFTDEQEYLHSSGSANFAAASSVGTSGRSSMSFNRGVHRGGFITAEDDPHPSPEQPVPPVPTESNEPMPVAFFECCNRAD